MNEIRRWIRTAVARYRDLLRSEVDDLEQDALLGLFEALSDGRFQHKSRFETYVRSYAYHKCIDRLRSHRRNRWTDLEEASLPGVQPAALRALQKKATQRELLEVWSMVPESCRELWTLLAEGHSYGEMANRLGVAEGTLRVRVLRCRRRASQLRLQSRNPEPRLSGGGED